MADMKMTRGIERIIALAALDAKFHRHLIQDREAAIDSCDIELSESERAVLLSIPNMQLDAAINKVEVPHKARRMFLRGAIYVAIGLVIGTCVIIPNILSAGMRADSAAAISTLRTIGSAQELYKTRHSRCAGTLKELVDADMLYEKLSDGYRSNYNFTMSSSSDETYEIRAIPERKSLRHFYMDQTGVIRYSEGPEVGPDSPPLGG